MVILPDFFRYLNPLYLCYKLQRDVQQCNKSIIPLKNSSSINLNINNPENYVLRLILIKKNSKFLQVQKFKGNRHKIQHRSTHGRCNLFESTMLYLKNRLVVIITNMTKKFGIFISEFLTLCCFKMFQNDLQITIKKKKLRLSK